MSLYYLVPRFPTATFDVGSRLGAITSECVIPENIHTPPPLPSHTHTHTHNGNSEGRGIEKEAISEGGGGGGLLESFFRGLGLGLGLV